GPGEEGRPRLLAGVPSFEAVLTSPQGVPLGVARPDDQQVPRVVADLSGFVFHEAVAPRTGGDQVLWVGEASTRGALAALMKAGDQAGASMSTETMGLKDRADLALATISDESAHQGRPVGGHQPISLG